MANNGWTPLGKKINLDREVQGTLPTSFLDPLIQTDVSNGYNLGSSTDGVPVLEGKDASNQLAFFRLKPGPGTTIQSQGNSVVITSTVLAGNTPGVMLTTTYDTDANGVVDTCDSIGWSKITGVPTSFPPAPHTHPESDIVNLVTNLASKVPTTRLVTTSFSLAGGGSLSADLSLSLIGDKANPGADMRYGTDPSGVLGWYPASVGAGDMNQDVYDANHNGIVDKAEAVVTGGILTAMLGDGAVTGVKIASNTIPASALVTGAAVTNLGYTPLKKAGDTATGQLVVLKTGVPANANMYQGAHFLAQTSGSGGGVPSIGLACLSGGANAGSVAIWYQGAHAELQLEYGDGTAAHLLSSLSSISGSQIAAASIAAAALASGVAQANLGFTPVNGSAGGTYVPTGQIIIQKHCGLAASSWANAGLQISDPQGGGGRPQIGFYYPGYAASLYFEPSDTSFRFIGSDGTARILIDTGHGSGNIISTLGYTPVNKAGDQMSGGLTIVSDYGANNGQLKIQATGGSQVAGITLISRGGYSFSFWAEDNGHVYLVCNNDGRTAQLL